MTVIMLIQGHRSEGRRMTQIGPICTFPSNMQLCPREIQLILLWVLGSIKMVRFGAVGGQISCPVDKESEKAVCNEREERSRHRV